MKKLTPNPPENTTDDDSLDPAPLSEITEPAISARLRNPKRADPISHIFTIVPGVHTETLLSHTCETLASLNVLITDLACKLESSNRNVALSIHQLAVVAESLVSRALDTIDPPEGASAVQPGTQH
jgi:hypothetical protein